MQTVLFDFHRQGCSLAKKISILRDGSSHRRVSLLPGDSHTPRRQSFVHLHRLQEAPALLAFVNGEIGACLILCDAVKISASALKNMNRADHLFDLDPNTTQLCCWHSRALCAWAARTGAIGLCAR
jgi:hypothetical protein